MKSMTRFLTAIVFAFISFGAFGQTPFYASYDWQRGQTFSDTVRFNDTLKTEGVQYLGGEGTQGLVTWNSDEETLDLITNGSTLQMGQEVVVHVRNNTGVDIPDGTAVMATGTLGASGRITVAPMVADGSIPARFYLGIATETIENGTDGKVTTFGKVRGINTTAYAEGSVLWLDPSTAGGLTTIQPHLGNLKIATALVISSKVNGTIFVRANTGTDLTTANDADLDSALDNSVIVRNSASGLWVHAGDYTQWDSAYAHKVNSVAFNTGDGVLSLSRQGGGVISTDLDGRYLTSYTETDPIFTASPAFGIDGGDITNWDSAYSQVQNNYLNWDAGYNDKINSASFNTGNGVLTLTQQDAGTVTADLDGRYLTSYTETDPIFTASTAFGISDADTTNWDSAYTAANVALNTLSQHNPNSQPIASQFFARARDSVGAGASGEYIEYFNHVNTDLGGLLNQTLSSGRTAYQDATIVYSPAVALVSSTPSIKPLNGDADLTFARASTGSYVDSDGVIQTASTNVPRIDFSSDVDDASLLLEPARTNLLTYSEQFDNAAWTKVGVAETANALTSPNGTVNADLLEVSADGARFAAQGASLTSGNTYTLSCYLRNGNTGWGAIACTDGSDLAIYTFDLSNGVIGSGSASSGAVNQTARIEDAGNGWYRCILTFDATSTATWTSRVYCSIQGINDFGGVVGENVYAWGTQLEAGSYPTSYIKTEASTVTRTGESLSKTFSPSISLSNGATVYLSLRGQTNGNGGGNSTPFLRLQLDGSNFIGFALSGAVWRARINTTTHGAFLESSPIAVEDDVQIAVSVSSSGWSMYANGVQFASGNDDCSDITEFTNLVNTVVEDRGIISVQALHVWDRALTDAQLQLLTTPISLN